MNDPGARPPLALTDLGPEEAAALVQRLGEEPFRARQLLRAAWRTGAASFAEMTGLPRDFRERLARELAVRALSRPAGDSGEIVSADGLTVKRIHRTWDGHEIESVWLEAPAAARSRRRLTACVSSQIGCAFGCAFCASGAGGLVRSLRAAEIAEQAVAPSGERPSHVVVMGMGEPMANYDEVLAAIEILNAPWGPGIGARRITVSTVGLVAGIRRLAAEELQVELAISLHAPDDGTRRRLCPGARATVAEIMRAAREYAGRTGRLVTFEYALVSGVNDSPGQARELARRLTGMKAKVNLIPLNPVGAARSDRLPRRRAGAPAAELDAPPAGDVKRFLAELRRGGVKATVRRERGADVGAACGQLRWRRLDPSAGARAGDPAT